MGLVRGESGVWSVLLWAAIQGRVTVVLSSPPYRTWNGGCSSNPTRSPEDPWAATSNDPIVLRESLIAVQDMFLWSLASVAKGKAIPFLKEIPSASTGTRSESGHGVRPETFWETETWKEFQSWARVEVFDFCQGSLGHEWLRPTVIGTNLGLRHLQGIPRVRCPNPTTTKGANSCASAWCTGFKKEIIEALEGRVKGPTIEEMDCVISKGLSKAAEASEREELLSSDDTGGSEDPDPGQESGEVEVQALKPADKEAWRAHIMRGHVPYRRDCQFCVEGSGLGSNTVK